MAAPTKNIFGVVTLSMALALAGCALRAKPPAAKPAVPKPAAPSAPPAPVALSIPQTQVELPKPQPIDPGALATGTPPQVPAETPAAPRAPAPVRKNTPTRTETTATPPPPVAAPSAEPTRQPVQEIVAAVDLKRLQEAAQNRKREVARILAQIKHPTVPQRTVINNIRSLVSLSDEAEKRNDMRQADALAERAQILARDLQHGK